MQKIIQKVCLIALLGLVATSYMTQAAVIQGAVSNGIQAHIIKKRAGRPLSTCFQLSP